MWLQCRVGLRGGKGTPAWHEMSPPCSRLPHFQPSYRCSDPALELHWGMRRCYNGLGGSIIKQIQIPVCRAVLSSCRAGRCQPE